MAEPHNRIALVTGAGKGIGREICKLLAACGADDIASPGEGVIIVPTPTPAPTARPSATRPRMTATITPVP